VSGEIPMVGAANLGYTSVYPVATVAKILLAQLLLRFGGTIS
jgi:uncharacterized transporter YbjL